MSGARGRASAQRRHPAEVGARETGAYAKAGRHLLAPTALIKKPSKLISVEIKANKARIIPVIQQVLKENHFLITELDQRKGIIQAGRDIELSLQEGLRSEFSQFEYKTLKLALNLAPLKEEQGWLLTIEPEILYLKAEAYIRIPLSVHSPYYKQASSIALAVENRVMKLKSH